LPGDAYPSPCGDAAAAGAGASCRGCWGSAASCCGAFGAAVEVGAEAEADMVSMAGPWASVPSCHCGAAATICGAAVSAVVVAPDVTAVAAAAAVVVVVVVVVAAAAAAATRGFDVRRS
jgi:hypothetical protein